MGDDQSGSAVTFSPGWRIVLLQGPVGPFFSHLQKRLDDAGHVTVRILFNAGDSAFHEGGARVAFSGRMADWSRWFESFLRNFKADAILLFGDQRTIHRQASAVAASLGVRTVCFEEGYLRPDFITMELGGNNAASPLRAWQGDEEIEVDAGAPMPNNGFAPSARFATRYFLSMQFGALRYPYYRHHRQRGVVREFIYWNRNAVRKWRHRFRNLETIQSIVEKYDARYFLVALQVHDDLQLIEHGCGWTVDKLIEGAIGSFARSAHPDHHLVLKGHPLDRGHSSSRELARSISAVFGVQDRVHYVDDGSLGLLSRHSRGMVTINSTSAMVSFAHGRPVFALGRSFYERMTVNGQDVSEAALSRFWRFTPQVDRKRWQAFRAHMIANSLVNGSYYIENEIDRTCTRVIVRLHALMQGEAPAAAIENANGQLAARG